MRCSAFPTSPYQIVPVQFTRDLWFKPSQEAEGSDEISEREAATYQKLIDSSREYARSNPKRTVEFEMKIFFLKAEQVVPEHQASR
jgi:hypothetical protein